MHKEPAWRDANLAVVAELAHYRNFGAGFGVSIGENDERGVATELKAEAFYLIGGADHEFFADLCGAGEGDFAADGVFEKLLGHFAAWADHQVGHASGQAGIDQAFKHLDEAKWGLGCRAADNGATCCQSGSDFARLQCDWEIPRADGTNDAHRVLDSDMSAAGLAVGDDLAIGPFAFLGKPFEGICRVQNLTFGLG